jgi:predicted RNase H-like HicB family nuclease
MKQVYPTFIVNIEDEPVHPFLVCVPDLDILTEGDSFADAIEMARDAIGVTLITLEDHNTEIPIPSAQDAAIEKSGKYSEEVDFSKGILTYVDIDLTEYRRKINSSTSDGEEKLKERLETFYGRPIDEIYMESDGTNSCDAKRKAYERLKKLRVNGTVTDDKAEILSCLDEKYGRDLTLDDIFKDYDGEIPSIEDYDDGQPVGREFGSVKPVEKEHVKNLASSGEEREMYNLIIKLESEGMSAEKIIETIKFMEEN